MRLQEFSRTKCHTLGNWWEDAVPEDPLPKGRVPSQEENQHHRECMIPTHQTRPDWNSFALSPGLPIPYLHWLHSRTIRSDFMNMYKLEFMNMYNLFLTSPLNTHLHLSGRQTSVLFPVSLSGGLAICAFLYKRLLPCYLVSLLYSRQRAHLAWLVTFSAQNNPYAKGLFWG